MEKGSVKVTEPDSSRQDTGGNSQPPKRKGQFRKGDPRINRGGRPRTFEAFRREAQEIATTIVTDTAGNSMTVARAILLSWARSKEPQLQRAFIEYAFGKVPDKLDAGDLLAGGKTTLILNYGHEKEQRDKDYQSAKVSRRSS